MQLAPNGKIYLANWWGGSTNTMAISVINNPNALGTACNYSFLAQSVAPKQSTWALPNFIGSIFVQPPPVPPYTFTVGNQFGCQGVAFTSPAVPGQTVTGCAAVGYSLTNLQWNFGDPASGSNNISTATNPIHAFTSLGTYTVKLKFFYSCGGGMDSTMQVVNVNQPCISVTSTSITCASLGSATVVSTGGIGPFSFTWMPSAQASSVATGLSPGTYTLTVFDFGNNFTYTTTTHFTSLIPLTGDIAHVSSVTCNGASTGTGNVTNIAGGSATQNFLWTNGTTSLTSASVNSLSFGIWTVSVVDATTGCNFSEVFLVTQPPALYLNLSTNTPTSCAGTSITLSGIAGGGTPGPLSGYSYSWTAGPANDTSLVSRALAGPYSYTLHSYDSLGCHVQNSISVSFIANPVLSIPTVSICPLEVGTLQVSGASSYVWFDNSTGNTLASSPPSTSVYAVVGSALGCTTAATGMIVVKPLPVPLFNSNSPRCNGDQLNLNAIGGQSFQWSGPLGFSSNVQHPVLTAVSPAHSGVYTFTVTAANSCTASVSGTVVVNPTPTLSAAGSTVCVNESLQLSSSSEPGVSFHWTGPASFVSTQQHPAISNPSVHMTGNYHVKATSALGCTNSAVAHAVVTASPVPSFVMNTPLCSGETLSFNASATSGGLQYSWSGPNGFSSSLMNPVISPVDASSAGSYTLTVITGPCVSTLALGVQVNPLPVPVISAPDEVCEQKPLSVSVHAAGSQIMSYLWHMPHATASQQFVHVPGVSPFHSGSYKATVTDINGCNGTVSKQITVLSNPVVTAIGDTVCLGQPARLKATGAATYVWYGKNLTDNSGGEAQVGHTDFVSPESYQVIGTAVNGCTAGATAMIHTDAIPKPSISVYPDDTICVNSVMKLSGKGGRTYEWKVPGGGEYTGQQLELLMDYRHPAGDYTLTVSDAGGCSGSVTRPIHLLGLPGGNLQSSGWQGCIPLCSEFNFKPAVGDITSKWTIDKKTVPAPTFSRCFTTPGEYIIKGEITDHTTGCKAVQEYTVTAYQKPVAEFEWEPSEPVESMDKVELTNENQGAAQTKWYWYIEGMEGYGDAQNFDYVFPNAGNYRVVHVVYNHWSCADTVVKVINVLPNHYVYIPDAFTPDGDGLNDVFTPIVNAAIDYRFEIFDRWGERVFLSLSPGEGWDGTFRGKPCQQAAYVWKMSTSDYKGEPQRRQGHVVLVR